MNAVKALMRAADQLQQRQPGLAFLIAPWKKFGDDQAGNLAALIAYYAFAALFLLLLVLVTILDITLRNNPELQQRVLNSALSQYPGIGDQLRDIGLIAVVGPAEIATIVLSSTAGGTGHVLTGAGAHLAAIAISLMLNVAVFWLAFRLATARGVATGDLLLGAVLAAIAWQVLQLFGSYLIGHQLATNSSLYGTFGIVLGLIVGLYLQAQITLYAVELNVVRAHRLWPRSLFPPPLISQDLSAYRLYARAARRRPELEVELQPADGVTDELGPPPHG